MPSSKEVSTPVRKFGRRSILNSSIVASPLRRSLVSGSSAALLPVDDEQERSNRRSIVEKQRRRTIAQSPLVDSLDEAQVQEHLKICTQLFVENKISNKNAWHLNVIDAIRKISAVTSNVLQVAGTSLDIGAKVYGIRVDDIYLKTMQLAHTMTNEKHNRQEENEDDAVGDVTTRHKDVRRKRAKKLAADKRNIIDTTGKTLVTSIDIIESPIFVTKENIEVSATDNLLAHRLLKDPSSHQIVAQSVEKYWSFGGDEILDIHVENIPILPERLQGDLCIPLKDFDIGEWDPEEEARLLAEKAVVPPAVLDENGVPIAELDSSVVDIFEDDRIPDDLSDGEQHEEIFHVQMQGEIEHIVDAVPETSRIANDFGFNELVKTTSGKFIDRIWAGPCHWKVKFNKASTPRYSGSSTHEVAREPRKKKVAVPIDLSNIDNDDITKKFGKYTVKRVPQTTMADKITLPMPEYELSMPFFDKLINSLFMKPGIRRPRINNNTKSQPDLEVSKYNYENNIETGSRHSDNEDNGAMADHSFEDIVVPEQEQAFDENLVNAESGAPVTYAMQAKKMNMKKLKEAVFNSISDETGQQGIVNFKTTTFLAMCNDVPRLLPVDMREELTHAMAFVALLHLCNENNLILTPINNRDFTISKA